MYCHTHRFLLRSRNYHIRKSSTKQTEHGNLAQTAIERWLGDQHTASNSELLQHFHRPTIDVSRPALWATVTTALCLQLPSYWHLKINIAPDPHPQPQYRVQYTWKCFRFGTVSLMYPAHSKYYSDKYLIWLETDDASSIHSSVVMSRAYHFHSLYGILGSKLLRHQSWRQFDSIMYLY